MSVDQAIRLCVDVNRRGCTNNSCLAGPSGEKGEKNQVGRRYFSRHEITALVSGPGNMAVYRHILVIPPTAKVLPPKNEKSPTATTLQPFCITAEKIPPYLGFTASAKKVPPTLGTTKKCRQLSIPPEEYRQLSIPPKRNRQHWIPPKRYRRHWISPKKYRRYWIPPKRYRRHWIPPKKYRLIFSCSFFVLCSFWFLGFLCGRTSL